MKPELLVTLLHGGILQVVVLLHVLQQRLDVRVHLVTEAAALLLLHVDTLDMDLHGRTHAHAHTHRLEHKFTLFKKFAH